MKASEVGLPTFEASVSCGQWCQGGSVNMQPTTYAEYEDAEFVWVRGDVAGAEIASLAARLAEAERDVVRLQWLADNPRGAQIVVDGRTQDCVFWGISGHPRATLREAIDTAVTAAGAPLQESP